MQRSHRSPPNLASPCFVLRSMATQLFQSLVLWREHVHFHCCVHYRLSPHTRFLLQRLR